MKIQTEILIDLSDAIFDLLAAHPHLIDVYAHGIFPRAQSVKDLNKRFRWDLFYAAIRKNVELGDKFREFNDNHIDTALRAIVPEIADQRGTVLATAFTDGILTVAECLREIRARYPAYVVSRVSGSAKVSVTGYRDEAAAKEKYVEDIEPHWQPWGAAQPLHPASLRNVGRTCKFPNGARAALRVHSPEGALK